MPATSIIRKHRGTGEFSQSVGSLRLYFLVFPYPKNPPTRLPVWEAHWGMGNFMDVTSADRRRVDRLSR